ncbi:unnamed protein product [Amoebophrya sp. A120]|nr:unnamed protein product [Amoebophrya sp. A120]|eukprot:GSA120T00012139001.1
MTSFDMDLSPSSLIPVPNSTVRLAEELGAIGSEDEEGALHSRSNDNHHSEKTGFEDENTGKSVEPVLRKLVKYTIKLTRIADLEKVHDVFFSCASDRKVHLADHDVNEQPKEDEVDLGLEKVFNNSSSTSSSSTHTALTTGGKGLGADLAKNQDGAASRILHRNMKTGEKSSCCPVRREDDHGTTTATGSCGGKTTSRGAGATSTSISSSLGGPCPRGRGSVKVKDIALLHDQSISRSYTRVVFTTKSSSSSAPGSSRGQGSRSSTSARTTSSAPIVLRCGRRPGNELVIDDQRISGIHFLLRQMPERVEPPPRQEESDKFPTTSSNKDPLPPPVFHLVDSSTNGVWVNGVPVEDKTQLSDGDVVTLLHDPKVPVRERMSFLVQIEVDVEEVEEGKSGELEVGGQTTMRELQFCRTVVLSNLLGTTTSEAAPASAPASSSCLSTSAAQKMRAADVAKNRGRDEDEDECAKPFPPPAAEAIGEDEINEDDHPAVVLSASMLRKKYNFATPSRQHGSAVLNNSGLLVQQQPGCGLLSGGEEQLAAPSEHTPSAAVAPAEEGTTATKNGPREAHAPAASSTGYGQRITIAENTAAAAVESCRRNLALVCAGPDSEDLDETEEQVEDMLGDSGGTGGMGTLNQNLNKRAEEASSSSSSSSSRKDNCSTSEILQAAGEKQKENNVGRQSAGTTGSFPVEASRDGEVVRVPSSCRPIGEEPSSSSSSSSSAASSSRSSELPKEPVAPGDGAVAGVVVSSTTTVVAPSASATTTPPASGRVNVNNETDDRQSRPRPPPTAPPPAFLASAAGRTSSTSLTSRFPPAQVDHLQAGSSSSSPTELQEEEQELFQTVLQPGPGGKNIRVRVKTTKKAQVVPVAASSSSDGRRSSSASSSSSSTVTGPQDERGTTERAGNSTEEIGIIPDASSVEMSDKNSRGRVENHSRSAELAGVTTTGAGATSTTTPVEVTNDSAGHLATSSTQLRDELLQDITCGVCCDVLYKPICVIPCLHNFCSSCYLEWVHTSVVAKRTMKPPKEQCPICRVEVTHRQLNCPLIGIVDTFLKNHPEKKRTENDLAEQDRKEANLLQTKSFLEKYPPNAPGRRRPVTRENSVACSVM